MKQFFYYASGTATGTLIYTAFISSAQEADWGRAIFVGIACGAAAVFWPRKKSDSGMAE